MKNDEISHIARKDNLIVKFGEINFEKVGQKNANYVSQRMHQLGRLLKTLRGKSQNEDSHLEDYIDTSKFDELDLAVKDLCGFDAESCLDIYSVIGTKAWAQLKAVCSSPKKLSTQGQGRGLNKAV